MTLQGWLALAQSPDVRRRIADEGGLDDFQSIVRVAARRHSLDWDEAIGILHMVYAWMPTMLRPTAAHTLEERSRLLNTLNAAKQGHQLDAIQLAWVQRFANRSVVGASKLLHVLNPANYVIWDSRVAEVFLWMGVTQATYSTLDRYVEYLTALRQWVEVPEVLALCSEIRKLNPALAQAGDFRLIELVLFRGVE
ncbi:hypothetical protein JZU46_04010 [bacterium]|jgi:hypothetical protein|nr:hypothetical protein [bacterium]